MPQQYQTASITDSLSPYMGFLFFLLQNFLQVLPLFLCQGFFLGHGTFHFLFLGSGGGQNESVTVINSFKHGSICTESHYTTTTCVREQRDALNIFKLHKNKLYSCCVILTHTVLYHHKTLLL